jgi:hypothetical protein
LKNNILVCEHTQAETENKNKKLHNRNPESVYPSKTLFLFVCLMFVLLERVHGALDSGAPTTLRMDDAHT